jgi:hypothetical protein
MAGVDESFSLKAASSQIVGLDDKADPLTQRPSQE